MLYPHQSHLGVSKISLYRILEKKGTNHILQVELRADRLQMISSGAGIS